MSGDAGKKTVLLLSETNFILDLTFEQAPECERLLLLSREQGIRLVIPEYSFAEAEGNITMTMQKRCGTIDTAISVLRQAGRSAYRNVTMLIQELEQFNVHSFTQEQPTLHTSVYHLMKNTSVIPFSAEIAARAELRGLRQLAPFKPSDRNIYESLLHFARMNQPPDVAMLFLTRDKADFDLPYIHKELADLSVELLFSAGDCIRRIRELVHID